MPANFTRQEFVDQARLYLGIPYTDFRGRISVREDGTLTGKVSCLSFVLFVAKDVGLISQEVNENIDRMGRTSNWDKLAQELLEEHCDKIPKSESRMGDLLKMRYANFRTAPWHIAIKTTDESVPTGALIHAVNYDIRGGAVVENRLDINEWNAIDSAWRIKGIKD